MTFEKYKFLMVKVSYILKSNFYLKYDTQNKYVSQGVIIHLYKYKKEGIY